MNQKGISGKSMAVLAMLMMIVLSTVAFADTQFNNGDVMTWRDSSGDVQRYWYSSTSSIWIPVDSYNVPKYDSSVPQESQKLTSDVLIETFQKTFQPGAQVIYTPSLPGSTPISVAPQTFDEFVTVATSTTTQGG